MSDTKKMALVDVLVAWEGYLWQLFPHSSAHLAPIVPVTDEVLDVLYENDDVWAGSAFYVDRPSRDSLGTYAVLSMDQYEMLMEHPETVVLLPFSIAYCDIDADIDCVVRPPRDGWVAVGYVADVER